MGEGISEYQRVITSLFARTGASAKLGLERTRALLEQLGNPHLEYPTFHVAGTNGKGSVVAMLDALLRSKGLRVGRYTSPHLIDFRERIVVDGEQITEREVVEFLRRWEPEGERIGATFFELTTAMAFEHFARARVDVAVIETGMGGRLDATNVLRPVATAVTSVTMDHTEYLGDTLAEIAREKAGIFKLDVPAVLGEVRGEAGDELRRSAEEVGASLTEAYMTFPVRNVAVTAEGTVVDFGLGDGNERRVTVGLVGTVQATNAAVALAMLNVAGGEYSLGLDEAAVVLPGVRVRGRFQRVGKFILDVAHNTAGISALVTTLKEVALPRPLIAVVGILRDKPYLEMMTALASVVDGLVVTQPPSAPAERCWDVREVTAEISKQVAGVTSAPELRGALELAERAAGTVLVTGSFHTVGDALQMIEHS